MNFQDLALTMALVAFGIIHEITTYFFQLRWKVYSRLFQKHGFIISAVQLGSVWIVVGMLLLWLLVRMEHVAWHHSLILQGIGVIVVCCGASLMWLSWCELGWRRVMKVRLFVKPEPDWVNSGIFQYLKDPMYRGSQLGMFGISLTLDSFVPIILALEMILLQQVQAYLENKKLQI